MKNAALWIVLGLGVFIIGLGVYAWSQEPMQREQQIDIATSTQQVDGLKVYADPDGKFSFSYPQELEFFSAVSIQKDPWSTINPNTQGILHALVRIPKSFEPQTNFGDALFSVGSTDEQNVVRTCTTVSDGTEEGETITVNGVKFATLTQRDAGAGQLYETVSYRTVWNGSCYAVEYTIHSSNIGAYDPNSGVKEFDRKKVVEVLEGIVESFKFTELANQDSSFDGVLVCLPHRDTSGPVTMECAYGVKTDSGTHYALRIDSIRSQSIANIAIGTKVRVSGSLVQPPQLEESREWKIYNVVGIMEVSSVAKI
jgi:hypothetical protein